MRKFTEDTQGVINRCKDLVEDYGKRCKSMTADDLLDIQDKLSVAYCYLGEVEAEGNKDYAISLFNRKLLKAKKIHEKLITEEKITAIKETIDSDDEIKGAVYDEIMESYLAENVSNLLKGLSKVLDAVKSRLTHLRDEKKSIDYTPRVS